MKKSLLFLSLVFLLGLSVNATDYYIASNGSDNNNGTSQSSPWRSLDKLNAYFSNIRPGDRIFLRRGDTFYGSINITKVGTAGSPITIGAFGSGEKPVVTGFTNVNSWNNLGGNIWESSTAVSSLSSLKTVVINGLNTPMGRYPNGDNSYPYMPNFLKFESHSGNTSISSSSLGGGNWTGADIVIRQEQWTINKGRVTSQSGNTLYYTGISQEPKNTFGLYIQNDPKTLDVQNEWYYNPSTRKIRIYSSSSPSNVQVTSIENLLVSDLGYPANAYINVDNISFIGANNNGIYFNGTGRSSISNCRVSYTGDVALSLTGMSNLTIENNLITDCGSSAIEHGNGSNLTIVENTILRAGLVSVIKPNDYNGVAVTLVAPNSLVQYNVIDSSGHSGISFRGANIQVRNNFINHSNMHRGDGGGIYTAHENEPGKVIDGNIILNSMGNPRGSDDNSYYAFGIYIDEFGHDLTISNNTIANSSASGLFLHSTQNVTVNNNTFYANGSPGFSNANIFIQGNSGGRFDSHVRGQIVTENIFFAKRKNQYCLKYYCSDNTNRVETFGILDNNYYAKPIEPSTAIQSWQNSNNITSMSVAQWKPFSGKDGNSKEAPKTISDENELRFEYNPTKQSKTISLDATYIDVKGNNYNGSITLAPYSSAVLIRTGAVVNQPSLPVSNAGSNQTITLPTNAVTLSGSGSVKDGNITSYTWTKKSGPSSGRIANPGNASTSVTELVEGTYVFELKVTDNNAASNTSSVQITVQPQPFTPVANAGSYQTISLPTNSVLLNGSGSVQGGTITSYNWTKKSGPSSGKIVNPGNASTSVTELVEGTYVFELKITDNKDASNISAVQITVQAQSSGDLLPSVNPPNAVNGLDYEYYEGSSFSVVPDFAKLTPGKTGNVNNFDISLANRPEIYAFSFNGYIDVPKDGLYTFYTASDDGSLLFIDNQLVVDNNGLHGTVEKSGQIGLKAGKHAISVGFFQQNGDNVLNVNYAGPGISKQSVPNSILFRSEVSAGLLPSVNPANTVNGLDYSYIEGNNYSLLPDFSKITPIKTGYLSNINLSIANRSEQFAINFTGFIDVPSDGLYTFYSTSDDGSMVYIDGVLVVNNDGLHGWEEKSGQIGLKSGKHAIRIGFFQATGDQGIEVKYSGPGVSKQLLSSSALYRISTEGNLMPSVNPSNTVNGIDYKYYEGTNYQVIPDFSKITPVKSGNISNLLLSMANRSEQYAINYTGFIDVPTDGFYTFYTTSDDGSKLYIDNVLIVDNDGLHGWGEKSGKIGLKAGKHAITVDFFQATGEKGIEVSYDGPGVSKKMIPSSVLYRISNTGGLLSPVYPINAVNGIDYKYYEGTSYKVMPNFSTISPNKTGTVSNFDISVANRTEVFAVNFTGYIDVPSDGLYTFYTGSDDGSMLYIDNVLVVNNDGLHGAVEKSGQIGLMAGKHTISVQFFQGTGYKTLQVSYGGPGFTRRIIPASVLYTEGSLFAKGMTGFGGEALASTHPLKDQSLQNSTTIGIKAFPNPFVNSIVVSINGEAGDFKLQMMDALGRTLWIRSGSKNAGFYQESVNTSSLQKGIYFLKVIQNGKDSVIKLLK